MKFMATFKFKADTKSRDEAIARFKKTQGLPPEGVTLLGRWTSADFTGGFDLMETNDVQALATFALEWSDLLEVAVVPVMDDDELKAVLSKHQ